MSSNEIRRLFNGVVRTTRTAIDHLLHWSDWRRQRQAQARASHYRKRLAGANDTKTPLQY